MEPKIISGSTYNSLASSSSRFQTQYFSDGSAIIVTERGLVLVDRPVEYEVKLPGQEPE
jgi:hypothetical protein